MRKEGMPQVHDDSVEVVTLDAVCGGRPCQAQRGPLRLMVNGSRGSSSFLVIRQSCHTEFLPLRRRTVTMRRVQCEPCHRKLAYRNERKGSLTSRHAKVCLSENFASVTSRIGPNARAPEPTSPDVTL